MICNIYTVDIKVCFYDLYIKVLLCIGPLGGLTLPPVQVGPILVYFFKESCTKLLWGSHDKTVATL